MHKCNEITHACILRKGRSLDYRISQIHERLTIRIPRSLVFWLIHICDTTCRRWEEVEEDFFRLVFRRFPFSFYFNEALNYKMGGVWCVISASSTGRGAVVRWFPSRIISRLAAPVEEGRIASSSVLQDFFPIPKIMHHLEIKWLWCMHLFVALAYFQKHSNNGRRKKYRISWKLNGFLYKCFQKYKRERGYGNIHKNRQ